MGRRAVDATWRGTRRTITLKMVIMLLWKVLKFQEILLMSKVNEFSEDWDEILYLFCTPLEFAVQYLTFCGFSSTSVRRRLCVCT